MDLNNDLDMDVKAERRTDFARDGRDIRLYFWTKEEVK
jgi:hypothetical protein